MVKLVTIFILIALYFFNFNKLQSTGDDSRDGGLGALP